MQRRGEIMYNPKKWDVIYGNGYLGKYPNEKIVRFICRKFGTDRTAHANIKVLDMGCGGGNNTWFLARENFNTYALDASEQALALAKKRMAEESLKATFVQSFFQNPPFPDEYFDAVVDDAAIEANITIDIALILKQVSRILKPSGRYFGCYLSSRNQHEMKGPLIEPGTYSETKGKEIGRNRCIHFSEENELKKWLDDAKFSKYSIDAFSYTTNNQAEFHHWWIVEAEK